MISMVWFLWLDEIVGCARAPVFRTSAAVNMLMPPAAVSRCLRVIIGSLAWIQGAARQLPVSREPNALAYPRLAGRIRMNL